MTVRDTKESSFLLSTRILKCSWNFDINLEYKVAITQEWDTNRYPSTPSFLATDAFRVQCMQNTSCLDLIAGDDYIMQ